MSLADLRESSLDAALIHYQIGCVAQWYPPERPKSFGRAGSIHCMYIVYILKNIQVGMKQEKEKNILSQR